MRKSYDSCNSGKELTKMIVRGGVGLRFEKQINCSEGRKRHKKIQLREHEMGIPERNCPKVD